VKDDDFLELFNQIRTIRSRIEGIERSQERLVDDNAVTHDLLTLLARPSLRSDITQALRSPAERRAYEYSDGERTSREIAELAGASTGSISNWWRRWRQKAIAVEVSNGRVRHLIPLSAIGISIEDDKA
jgi:hypothetical protein